MEPETEQVAIVTGGGGGIGMAIAARVVATGGSVVIGDLNDDRGKAAVTSLDAPDRTRFVHVDVSHEGDIEALVVAATDTFGRQRLRALIEALPKRFVDQCLVALSGALRLSAKCFDHCVVQIDRDPRLPA